MNDISLAARDARSVAEIATPNASRYLQQLCKHFAHKRPVTFDAETGRICLDAGECDLAARDGLLVISVTAPDRAGLDRSQGVVARHLLRFSFREDLAFDWQPV